jgi:phosphopantetheinyl transferase (holo-ACP synthase)
MIVCFAARVPLRQAGDELAKLTLTPSEREWRARATTRRRLAEMAAGRCAAKLAASVALAHEGVAVGWQDIDIQPALGRSPRYKCGGRSGWVSISHTRDWAVALVSPEHRHWAVDIEQTPSRAHWSEDFFAPCERHADMLTPWMLKEVCGKLSGHGIAALAREIVVLRFHQRWWIALTPVACSAEGDFFTGTWGKLSIAAGLRSSQ